MKRVLCIWLPNWPVQRLLVAQPELRTLPLVLHARDPRRGQRVVHCDSAAQEQGIAPGMSLAEVAATMRASQKNAGRAERTSQRRTDQPPKRLHVLEHDPEQDRIELEALAGWCEQFSPAFGLESSATPSSLLLDVTSSAARLGGEQRLACRVSESFQQRGYVTRVAIAETIGSAWAIAHFDDEHQDSGELLYYPIVVPTGETLVELGPLPIESLRLESATVDLLHQLGVRTNAQLFDLPRDGLKSRFGPQLLERMDQATGRITEPFTFHHAPQPLEAQMSLEYPTNKRAVVEECVSRLLQQLCEQLKEQGSGALGVDCCLSLMDRTSITIHVGLFHPSWELTHLQQLLQMQLDQRSIPSKVHKVSLSVSIATRLEHRQAGLPGDLAEELSGVASQQLAYLIDRMSNRLGRDTVVGARLLSEPNIEGAYRYRPLTGQRTAPLKSTAAAERQHLLKSGLRPLHVNRPPVRLHVRAAPNCSTPPRSFGYAGQQRHTRHFWGPERIETGWWSGRMIRRDYYQVEDNAGNRFWLFLDLNQHEWFLHGLF